MLGNVEFRLRCDHIEIKLDKMKSIKIKSIKMKPINIKSFEI